MHATCVKHLLPRYFEFFVVVVVAFKLHFCCWCCCILPECLMRWYGRVILALCLRSRSTDFVVWWVFHEIRRKSRCTYECQFYVCIRTVHMVESYCTLQPVANYILSSQHAASLIEFVGINKITHAQDESNTFMYTIYVNAVAKSILLLLPAEMNRKLQKQIADEWRWPFDRNSFRHKSF